MQIVLCFLIGYLIGNINPAYILSKLNGFDIRERGSGNAGASNVTMIMGKKAGVFTALFDISKAFIASEICKNHIRSFMHNRTYIPIYDEISWRKRSCLFRRSYTFV